jgi:hypothetical protein
MCVFKYHAFIYFLRPPPWYGTVHYLINVRTWAIFFSRHLANVSSMVPLWASTDSGFVPNLGPRIRSHTVRRRLFIVFAGAIYSPMIAAHFLPNVFPSETSSATYMYYFSAYIHRARQSLRHFFNSSWQADCSRSFMSDTHTYTSPSVLVADLTFYK